MLASALKCWNCENVRDAFCDDRFDYSMISEDEKYNHYHECIGTRCVKVVYDIGGK